MRTLIYVPVIHTSADLGSLAEEVTRRNTLNLGENVYKEHQETVDALWTTITEYFDSIDVSGMKLYQDGMVVDGSLGRRIVDEGSRLGSKNYELVVNLIKRGALLIKTEDFNLVKEERDRLLAIVQEKSTLKRILEFIKYKMVKDRILDKRDDFITKRIDETLNQSETGIIFIGAYHNIKKKLSKDIQIKEVKDTCKVREYQRILPFYYRNKERFKELGNYLISPIIKGKGN